MRAIACLLIALFSAACGEKAVHETKSDTAVPAADRSAALAELKEAAGYEVRAKLWVATKFKDTEADPDLGVATKRIEHARIAAEAAGATLDEILATESEGRESAGAELRAKLGEVP